MSILTRKKIIEAIRKGKIRIEPYFPGNVGPGSVDLTLGDVFRVFRTFRKVFDVNADSDYRSITTLVKARSIVLNPQATVLGITVEKITLAPDLCGWLEGRSKFARLGLMVHISASFMQPGISNRQVLEIINMGPVALAIHPGIAICQFIFEE